MSITPNPKKDPNEKKKPSFWERLSEKKATNSGSLVDAIVRQAEKEASLKKEGDGTKKDQNSFFFSDNKAKNKARALLSSARTISGIVIFIAICSWLYFFAMLHESNYFHGKFGFENLTTEMNRKVELSAKISVDIRDTKKFGNFLKVENLASHVLEIDLDSLILNYKAPVGERVVSRSSEDQKSEIFVKTTNNLGKIIYVSEAEIRILEDARDAQIDFTKSSIEEIIELVDELQNVNIVNDGIKENFAIVLKEIQKIDLEAEKDRFPSSVLKSIFATAQSAAKNIRKEIKNSNLRNLVTDIKNQIQTIDIIGADEPTQKVVVNLQNILTTINSDRPSTFENALVQIETVGIGDISDNAIYSKVVRIIGDSRSTEKDIADLQTAAMIAQNIGRVNIVNILESARIVWSTVIERTQKIARLGSDLERDLDGIPTNENRDLDPDGELIGLFTYSGESNRDQIEIQGWVAAEQNYEQRAFTLLADLIDAIEASKYFKNVEGFSFSKETDRDKKVTAPFSLSLILQDPAITDDRDVEKNVIERPTEILDKEDSDLGDIEFLLNKNNVDNNDESEAVDS